MPAFLENEDYDFAHEAFLRSSNHNQQLENCFRENLPKILRRLNLESDKSTLNILSIGAGNGKSDTNILKLLLESVESHVHIVKSAVNRAIEPSGGSLEKYRGHVSNISAQDAFVQKVKFEFENKTFDEYSESDAHLRNQFDFIHAVNSFYFNKDVHQSLQHCYTNELCDKGAILLVAGKEDTSIFRKIAVRLKKVRCKYSDQYILSQGFIEIAQKCEYQYSVHPFAYSIDITEIGASNPEANLLLDFFTFEKDFRKKFDKTLVNEVLDILRSGSKDVDGRVFLETLGVLVVVYKQ